MGVCVTRNLHQKPIDGNQAEWQARCVLLRYNFPSSEVRNFIFNFALGLAFSIFSFALDDKIRL